LHSLRNSWLMCAHFLLSSAVQHAQIFNLRIFVPVKELLEMELLMKHFLWLFNGYEANSNSVPSIM